jgi:dephospho-CoA kinase
MTFVLGLTGSIGMGKSTTAQMFRDEGIPVWDADAVVRDLYAPGGGAAKAVAALFPTAMTPDGAVSRAALRDLIRDDASVLDRLNAVVHPLVAQARQDFIAAQTDDLVVLDVPLLFETGASSLCDGILVVTAPPDVQRQRVLDRGEMTAGDLETILSRQMPDAEKRARADHVIETLTLDGTRAAVRDLIARIRKGQDDA